MLGDVTTIVLKISRLATLPSWNWQTCGAERPCQLEVEGVLGECTYECCADSLAAWMGQVAIHARRLEQGSGRLGQGRANQQGGTREGSVGQDR